MMQRWWVGMGRGTECRGAEQEVQRWCSRGGAKVLQMLCRAPLHPSCASSPLCLCTRTSTSAPPLPLFYDLCSTSSPASPLFYLCSTSAPPLLNKKRLCRGGAEVIEVVQRWCRGGTEVVQRWSGGDVEEVVRCRDAEGVCAEVLSVFRGSGFS